MNKQRAEKLIKTMTAYRDNFSMTEWWKSPSGAGYTYKSQLPESVAKHECGTTCCIAGFAALESKVKMGVAFEIAKRWLQVDKNIAEWLFMGHFHAGANGRGGLYLITLEQAITAINWLVAGGDPEANEWGEGIYLFDRQGRPCGEQ